MSAGPQLPPQEPRYRVLIDRGGTFTDCIGIETPGGGGYGQRA